MAWTRALPTFSVVFVVAYLISMDFHPTFTLFTYAPRLGQWFWGVPNLGARGPGMFWWSWLTTGALAGLLAGLLALAAPESLRRYAWPGLTWLTPAVATMILLYIERPWFGFK